jgi:uncharacterized protein (DUF885 family)
VSKDTREFDEAEEELFYGLLERNPIMGTNLGLHQYDDLMPDGSRAALDDKIEFNKRYRDRFEGFDPKGLPDDKAISRDAALYLLDLNLFYMEELRFWEKMPTAPDVVGDAIYLIYAKDYAPVKDRLRSITRRLESSPKYIEETKELLNRPVKLWVDISIDSASFLPSLLETVLKSSKDKLPERDFKELEVATTGAREALEEYKVWLADKSATAKEDYVLSEEQFEKLIELRRIGLTSQQILDVGYRYLENEKKKEAELAAKLGIPPDVESINKLLTSKCPKDFDETLTMYRKSIEDSRKFVVDKEIATLPPNEKLLVMETPEYLAHTTPFAMYFSPAKFDKTQLGLYLVTPSLSEKDTGKHNFASISNTTVHEGYPGHHLQLSCANTHPSLVRLVSHATETVEGWAHYCEELMMDKGYHDDLAKLSEAIDAAWRAARVIIDVKLSTGKMSFDEAVAFLIKEVGMPKDEAEGEIKRYTQMPSYNFSYLLGKHLIKELKSNVAERMGPKFSEKFFHDTILYSGSLPISFFEKVFDSKLKEVESQG